MLHRFAAACAVAGPIIALGAAASLLLPRWSAADVRILTTAWCFVPLAWGLWAMLAPANWVPRRLPQWGAILGIVAGFMAGPVLDLPQRLAGLQGVRWTTLLVGPVFYYLLWLLVAIAYRSLRVAAQSACAVGGSPNSER